MGESGTVLAAWAEPVITSPVPENGGGRWKMSVGASGSTFHQLQWQCFNTHCAVIASSAILFQVQLRAPPLPATAPSIPSRPAPAPEHHHQAGNDEQSPEHQAIKACLLRKQAGPTRPTSTIPSFHFRAAVLHTRRSARASSSNHIPVV